MAEGLKTDKQFKTIHEFLGLPVPDLPFVSETKAPPAPNLPIVPDLPAAPEAKSLAGPEPPLIVPKPPYGKQADLKESPEYKAIKVELPQPSKAKRLFTRDMVRYPLIFVVGFGFFYAILNFPALKKQVSGIFARTPKAATGEAKIATQDLAEYNQWIKKYYFFLNDQKILSDTEDPDQDGLTNSQEFYLETNPLSPDTDNDGYDDGIEVLHGYNPLYEGKLNEKEQNVVSDHIDLTALASRKSFQRVASETTSERPTADSFEIDTSRPGNLKIPKLAVDVQISWPTDVAQMEENLKHGVVHHPLTPLPGSQGTVSIHGHSSGNPWDGDFQTIFTKLNFLQVGDEVLVTVYNPDGQSRKLRYIVKNSKVYAKTDPMQFDAGNGYFLNLSTSWPIGTAHQRYVVTTELVGI